MQSPMRARRHVLDGTEYCLCYNNLALLMAQEAWPDMENEIDLINKTDAESGRNLAKMAAIMSECGELLRRHCGYEPGAMLSQERVEELVTYGSPGETMALRNSVMQAVVWGYKRDIDPSEDKEIDIILLRIQAEKQKKTENP